MTNYMGSRQRGVKREGIYFSVRKYLLYLDLT